MINKIFAGFVFLFSLIIYILTMAPTTSFWDCGEFIATSYTLGVPHPPGTPLYLLIGNVFSTTFFFIDDIGARVNLISPIVSALSVMFVYLITVQLIKKWFTRDNNKFSQISIYCSALIGSLLFAFTDSQWFNAVEAEVYGMSTFFTAIVVWLALKWSEKREENGNARYIILIAYLMGLAIGVHLLNLLAIPFIGLIIYFSSSKDNISGFLIDNFLTYILGLITFIGFDIFGVSSIGSALIAFVIVLLSLALRYLITFLIFESKITLKTALKYLARISVLPICGVIFYIINNGIIRGIPHMIKYWDSTERLGLSISENFTLFIFPLILIIILVIGIITCIILENLKKTSLFGAQSNLYNLFKVSIVSLFMIYIGFSTYSTIFIRAGHNPNINENDPSDKASFVKYMNREQYGTEHNSIDWYNTLKYYLSIDGYEKEYIEKYDKVMEQPIQIGSSDSGLEGSDNKQRWLSSNYQDYINNAGSFDISKVSNKDILKFIRSYQFNEMYFRYFGWQFIGKEYAKKEYSWDRSDSFNNKRILPLQDNGEIANIDWFRYGFPFAFIFGMIGLIYHFIRDPKRALSVLVLFLATGIAIVLYLNQHDPQPRERDYSYVGSFFAFSIWIGIGCMALFDFIKYLFNKSSIKKISKSMILIPISILTLILLIIPLTHLIKDYSVHNRSGNFTARDYGYNILTGCKPNSVIFTNGDNDTFPLWYSQEVEKNRTDVRVINLSLLNASWYIKQLYNNNAPGTIQFNFNEPIITASEYLDIIEKAKEFNVIGSVPIFINNNGNYYIDINNNKKYDEYNTEETLTIIQNLEDPITATIYAYKRWDPAAWASIESSYLYYEIARALESPKEPNILKIIYGNNYQAVMSLMEEQVDEIEKEYNIEDPMELFSYKINSHIQYINYFMDTDQDGVIGIADKTVSDYLDEFVQTGNGTFEEDASSLSRWGMTPDNINGKNYPYYYLEIPVLNYSNELMNIYNLENKPTLQGVAFRVQDVMILKIIEDLNSFPECEKFEDLNNNLEWNLGELFVDENQNGIWDCKNSGPRSIYFATTVSPSSQMSLNTSRLDQTGMGIFNQVGLPINYFTNQGMILELTSDIEYQTNLNQGYDVDMLYTNLIENYNFKNLNNERVYYSSDNQRILQNYRILFLTLAELLTERELQTDKNIMAHMNYLMPDNVIKYDPNRDAIKLWAAQNYAKANMNSDASRLTEELLLDLEKSIDSIQEDYGTDAILTALNSIDDLFLEKDEFELIDSKAIQAKFYTNLLNNIEIATFSGNYHNKGISIINDLFKIYYRGTYNDGTNISDFIYSIEQSIEENLDTYQDIEIEINELIISEIYKFSISYQGDEYVQTFIAILRDNLVEKYKSQL